MSPSLSPSRFVAFCALLAFAETPAPAQPLSPTPEQVEQRVAQAAAFYRANGLNAFCAAVSDPDGPFQVDEAYVFALARGGAPICHPRPDLFDVPTGAPSSVPQLLRNAESAAPDGAWTRYVWPHPETFEVGEKSTYCQVADDAVICAGAFFISATS